VAATTVTIMEATRSRWIVSPSFDLFWFFGGAIASILILAAFLALRVPIVALVWVGILLFDGPHMAAAYSRTYLDGLEWRQRRRVLVVPLLAFLVGPLCLAANLVTGSELPFLAFLGGVTFYAYFHVVRQHWGFLALYRAKAGERGQDVAIDRWSLYVACWTPYAWFLLTHPKARALVYLTPEASPMFVRVVTCACAVVFLSAIAAFVSRAVKRRAAPQKVGYFLVTVALYALAYFWVGRMEPVYPQSSGPDQDFLLLSLVVGVFHNMQYVGLVWFHNRNRYGTRDAQHGLARHVNASPLRYLGFAFAFSLGIYLLVACSTGVYPGCQAFLTRPLVGAITVNQLGLSLWWGIALHHYYLDQKIWRIRGDDRLRRDLGLA
jgi:hypothetical protein